MCPVRAEWLLAYLIEGELMVNFGWWKVSIKHSAIMGLIGCALLLATTAGAALFDDGLTHYIDGSLSGNNFVRDSGGGRADDRQLDRWRRRVLHSN